jgi:hypothetical protein
MRYRRHLLAALIAPMPIASAQDPFVTLTTYEISIPVGDTRQFVPNASLLGLTWEGRWAVASRVSAGMMLGLNEFSHRFTGTTNFPSGAATGPQFRYILSMPLLATGYVYPYRSDRRQLYLGGGAGVARVDQLFELGTRQLGRGAWHFVFAPEVGAEMHGIRDDFIGVVSVRYNAPVAMGDYVGGGARSFRHVTIRLGFGYEMGEYHPRRGPREYDYGRDINERRRSRVTARDDPSTASVGSYDK